MKIFITGALLLLLNVTASFAACGPSPLTVTNSGDSGTGSLREALSCCNSGTINFSIPTPWTITLTSGELVLSHSCAISGPGEANGTVSGAGLYRVINATYGGDLSISGLTIKNGLADLCPELGATCGGGIKFVDPLHRLTLNHVVIDGCRSTGTLGSSGALYLQSNGSTFSNTTISNNFAPGGGAIDTDVGALTLIQCVFNGNSSKGLAGAVLANGLNFTVEQSTFFNNSAPTSGGALFLSTPNTKISNSTFYANSAASGGAILNSGSTTVINNVTFAENTGTMGGTIRVNSGSLTISNSIIDGTSSCSGSLTNGGYNLDTGNSCGFVLHDTPSGLLPLAANGGYSPTMALLPSSGAINAGNPNLESGTIRCESVDQRSVNRVACDIGAYEFVLTLFPPSRLRTTVNYTTIEHSPFVR